MNEQTIVDLKSIYGRRAEPLVRDWFDAQRTYISELAAARDRAAALDDLEQKEKANGE